MIYANPSFDEAYRDRFMFGTSYAPYALGEDWPQEEWEPDILRMKEMGFNTVRIFAAWSRIEVREDRYDFGPVDAFFALARKHGMRVILNFGGLFGNACGCGRPWYLRDLPAFCHDDPYVADRAERFLRRVIVHCRGEACLAGWMIWNEPNNMEHCRCEHTLKVFRGWLQEKYGRIDALNRAW